jgi:transposase-like protein
MSSSYKVTDDQARAAVVRMLAGERIPDLAAELGCAEKTLRRAIRRAGYTRSDTAHRPKTMTSEVIERVLELYEAGVTHEEISRRLGISRFSIHLALKKLNKPRRYKTWVNSDGYHYMTIPVGHPLYEAFKAMRGKENNINITVHRFVMAEHLGRALMPWETVHHIDGDRGNNNIENLQLRQGRHGKGASFSCMDCGSHNIIAIPLPENP